MSNSIVVDFYSPIEPLTFDELDSYVAESLIIESCKYLGIKPVGRLLFGLWSPTKSAWHAPNDKFDLVNGDSKRLCLRLRFRTPDIDTLVEKTDPVTCNYYFHQVHSDFLEGRIEELHTEEMLESALGLVATDIIRVLIESNMTIETMKFNRKMFLPHSLKKNPVWDNFLEGPIKKAVHRGYCNSRQNADFVKVSYLQTLYTLVPDYGSENFSALIDDYGKIYQVDLIVNPYEETYPGIRMRVQQQKHDWMYVCSIEELCYISVRSDRTVEISRQNGVPQYVQFSDTVQMNSFLSLLDGYYRLTEKWTFNLCKDLITPSLIQLRAMKCHGPVGAAFSHKKLKERSSDEDGSYIIRESETAYDEYYVDVLTSKTSSNISTYCIKKDNDSYSLSGTENSFESIQQLLTYHATYNNKDFSYLISASEFDKSNLLLCRKKNGPGRSLPTRGDCSCSSQCIPHDAIAYSNDVLQGKFTIVAHGSFRRSCADAAVAVKMLRKEAKETHLLDFLSQCDKVLFWQHENIISTYGMILTNPSALVMEWLPLGTLDKHLAAHRNEFEPVELIEAAFYIARALWYLEGKNTCHGNIRCHNILVYSHTDKSFKVKLGDPGVFAYTDADLYWIPPECFNNYSKASRSILADVYAYGTTLWEMYSFGAKPNLLLPPKELKEWFLKGQRLPFPNEWHIDITKIIRECWLHDQHIRKRPQAIVRDVNQNLYEVYNSRRNHSYATIDASTVIEDELPVNNPPLPNTNRPSKESNLKKFKNIFKWPGSLPMKGFSYNHLSQSKSTLITTNTSSANSTVTILPDDKEPEFSIDTESSMSLQNVSESEIFHFYKENCSVDSSWVICVNQLDIIGKIGEGFYGEVSKAKLKHKNGEEEMVAVKRIKVTTPSLILHDDMLREMTIMRHLNHKNIVRIIGVVEDCVSMLVMEYVDNGSLLNHLQCSKSMQSPLDISELLRFSLGIAEGMMYLESKHVVHRDLAARNILVGSNNMIKISDFGLAHVIKDPYYKMKTDRNLPVRWYAIEAIMNRKFSHKSDVWSYGIVLWEIFSHGENPQIPDVLDVSLHEALQRGQRLQIPEGCPSTIYTLMRRCWEKNSHDRPTFLEIIDTLENFKRESL